METIRKELTEKIVQKKIEMKLKWADLAKEVNLSKEFLITALLGKMPLPAEPAKTVGNILGLNESEIEILQKPPTRPISTPSVTQPNLHRLNEIIGIYGETIKELIDEEFGDGIISAVDFRLQVTKEEDINGDRVNISMSGKFLPYKPY